MKRVKLQTICFPIEEKYYNIQELFYKGEKLVYDFKKQCYQIPAYKVVDFSTYINMFSLGKWKTYSNIQDVKVYLKLKGHIRINFVGYHLDIENPIRVVFDQKEYFCEEETTIEYTYPKNEESSLSIELETLSDVEFYEGYYTGDYVPEEIREVNLSIVTTTFKKEEFILPNIELIHKELIESKEEISNHITLHVIDNGRTLNIDTFPSEQIRIHPNKNVGGAGGFARGMIESMEQTDKATHVLLMDDDVLVLAESIKRTYILLGVLKKEYQEHFISGAMLCYEKMNIQHEDIGYVHYDGSYGPVKKKYDHRKLAHNLESEQEVLEHKYTYAGWWYCCIPMQYIENNGLPLPLFIRGDDVEYSLRGNAKFITMNGICIWHMGFTYKFNAAMELYQVHRNSLIFQATSGVCGEIDFFHRMKNLFTARMVSLDYNGAELILDALEDFMKGPSFIMQDLGEQIMQEKFRKNETLIPLNELGFSDINLEQVYCTIPRRFIPKWLYRITYNGHRLCSNKVLKKGPGIIAYDWFYSPEANFWNENLLAINVYTKCGSIRRLDKQKYKVLLKRWKKVSKNYLNDKTKLVQEYQNKKNEVISKEFWKKYLEI